MSKVETLRCEICGKTYLSDEGKNDVILAISGEKDMAYNDICPRCRENIHKVVENPEIIKDLTTRLVDMRQYADRLGGYISTIHNKMFDWYSRIQSPTNFEKMKNEIVSQYTSTDDARHNWKSLCCVLAFISTVMFIKLVVG